MKRVALYDPYLDTLGGGEKHILSILKVLQEEGYEINIFWDESLQQKIEDRFSLQLINQLRFLPNIFKTKNTLKTLRTLRTFDLFFYVTDGSYFFSPSKKNYIFAMVPNKKLYNQSLINKLKTSNYRFITNSKFTQNWLKTWGVRSEVVYPYVNKEFIDLNVENLKKENIILSVGRFYNQLHSKKQSILINWFNKLQQKNLKFKQFKLILAGGLKEEDKSYFTGLKLLAKNNPNIELIENLSFSDLSDLYKKSTYYVHMTGYGVDENKNPEQVEHLGITPLEAMASGCITFCYKTGGPKEIIQDNKTGFLFNSENELTDKLDIVSKNLDKQSDVKSSAKKFVSDNFSYEVFEKRVKDIIL